MSKMSAVHQELHEYGYDEVKMIEDYVNELNHAYHYEIPNQILVDSVVTTYKVHPDTAQMIIAGASEFKCSNMLKESAND
jgi:hypothetical protein